MVTTVKRTIAPPELRPYLVDVEEDLVLAHEDVAAQRDLLSTVLEANLAVISVEQTEVSVRQNATIEQLTIMSHPGEDTTRHNLRPGNRPGSSRARGAARGRTVDRYYVTSRGPWHRCATTTSGGADVR